MNNNSNTFRTNNEGIFLLNILNTMYNDNLRQINNLIEILNNLNNSNNQIRNTLVQLLSVNQGNGNNRHNGYNRRNHSIRFDNNSNNFENNTSNENSRNFVYLIDEYTIPINRNRINNANRNRLSTMDSLREFTNFFQPVEIYPTQYQIEAATRRVRYCDIARPINTSCPISMEEFNDNDMVIVIRHCGHTFHNEHIMNWFRSNCHCPVCRYDIREYNSNVFNRFFDNTQDSSGNNVERINNNNNNNNNNHNNNNNNNTLFDENSSNTISTSIENILLNGIFDPSGNYTNNQMVHGLHNILNLLNNRNQNF